MKTLIAVPCMDSNPVGFTHSLAILKKEGDCTLSMMNGSLIYESRNKLSRQALGLEADYILWLDSDMIFPPDTLIRMLEHMKDKDFVTGLYFRRGAPFSPVIFESYETLEDGRVKWKDQLEYPKDELFEVAGCGFGCVMMKTTMLLDMALNYSEWFAPISGMGEDLAFCWRARKLGYKLWCDPTIKLGHVAHMTVDETVWQTIGGADEVQSAENVPG